MKKKNKFLLLIFIALLTVCIAVCVCGCSGKKTEIVVMSDLHFVSQKLFTESNYEKYATEDKMEHLGEAIIRTVADELDKSDPDYLLVSGDLTEYGDKLSHEELAKVFSAIEKKGTKVYVINGNHDLPTSYSHLGEKVTADEFKNIYAEFGYNEALSTCEGTLSYSADLGKNHRLIAVDNIEYFIDVDGEYKKSSLGSAHEKWIKEEIFRCEEDGKIPVIMSHIPFKSHFPKIVSSLMFDKSSYIGLAKYFADNGANLAFTGHLHVADVQKVTSDEGNDFYDIANPSMIHFPCSYRSVKLTKEGFSSKTVKQDKIDEKYLSALTTEEEKTTLRTGLQAYAEKHMLNAITAVVDNLDEENGLLGSYVSGDDNTSKAALIAAKTAKKALYAPLYTEDEKEGEISVERCLASFGVTLPKVGYKSVLEMSTVYAASVFSGEYALKGKTETEIIGYFAYYFIYLLNEQRGELNEILPSVEINVDMEKLVSTGILECYESGVVPFLLEVVHLPIDLKPFFGEKFNIEGFMPVLSTLTGGAIDGLDLYFVDKEIKLYDLIYDGIFGKYAPELYEKEIDDSEFSVSRQ